MQRSATSLQDVYLEKLMKAEKVVTIKLVGGMEIRGKVGGYDNFTVILLAAEQEILIYKHAVSTITTEEPVILV